MHQQDDDAPQAHEAEVVLLRSWRATKRRKLESPANVELSVSYRLSNTQAASCAGGHVVQDYAFNLGYNVAERF
jgi:hypothetical protein